MREDKFNDESLIADLGAASDVTLGIPQVSAYEDLTTPDFRD